MRSDTADSTETTAPPAVLPTPGGAPPAPVEATERTFRFDGFAYHCRIVRQGTSDELPMLLLGGSSQDRRAWLRHEKWLTARSTLVTVDLPGYGSADFLPARYGIDFLAAALRHLLTELDVPRVHLVGACFGGAVALRFAQHYPQYVARLALGGMTRTIPRSYAEAVPRWVGMLERGERAEAATELVQRFMAPPQTGLVRKREVVARLLYQQFMAQSEDDVRKTVEHNTRLLDHEWYRPEPAPEVPSMVFTGEHDTLCSPAMGREVAGVLPAAEFLTVREADHLVSVERMADFADLLVRFSTGSPLTGLPYCNPVERYGVLRSSASASASAAVSVPVPVPVHASASASASVPASAAVPAPAASGPRARPRHLSA